MTNLDTTPPGKSLGTWGGIDDLGPAANTPTVAAGRTIHGTPKYRNLSALVERGRGALAVAVRFGGTGWDDVWVVDRDGDLATLRPAPDWENRQPPYPTEAALAEVCRILAA